MSSVESSSVYAEVLALRQQCFFVPSLFHSQTLQNWYCRYCQAFNGWLTPCSWLVLLLVWEGVFLWLPEAPIAIPGPSLSLSNHLVFHKKCPKLDGLKSFCARPLKNGLWPTEGNAAGIIESQPLCLKWLWKEGSLTPLTWGKIHGEKRVARTSQSSSGCCCLLWQRHVAMYKISAEHLEIPYRKVKTGQVIWNSQGVLSTVWSVAPSYGQGTKIMKLSKITA